MWAKNFWEFARWSEPNEIFKRMDCTGKGNNLENSTILILVTLSVVVPLSTEIWLLSQLPLLHRISSCEQSWRLVSVWHRSAPGRGQLPAEAAQTLLFSKSAKLKSRVKERRTFPMTHSYEGKKCLRWGNFLPYTQSGHSRTIRYKGRDRLHTTSQNSPVT